MVIFNGSQSSAGGCKSMGALCVKSMAGDDAADWKGAGGQPVGITCLLHLAPFVSLVEGPLNSIAQVSSFECFSPLKFHPF